MEYNRRKRFVGEWYGVRETQTREPTKPWTDGIVCEKPNPMNPRKLRAALRWDYAPDPQLSL
jgi:hypothetical protein